jgi:hypothetical protein
MVVVDEKRVRARQFRLPYGTAKLKAKRTCPYCDGYIHTAKKGVKTCGSAACREKHFANKHGPKPETTCMGCGVIFSHSRTAKRKFCSYACHIKSGGAFRAGAASKRAVKNYGAKKDANHNELVAEMEKLCIQVLDTSGLGGGFPDCICNVRKRTLLVEIKNPKTAYGRKGLNDLQKLFADNWRGSPVYIVRTLDDVILLANLELDKLDHFGGG